MLKNDNIVRMHVRARQGFTLIELLVVISLIGLLASIIFASLTQARAKGRDTKRLADLRDVQTVLELYASDNGGTYPSTGGNWWGVCSVWGSHDVTGSNGWVPNVSPAYLPALPVDPKPIGTNYCYLYRSNTVDYMILAYGTVETFTSSNNPRPRPLYPWDQTTIAYYTPGASGW